MPTLAIASDTTILAALIMLAAALYSSVGHAGASGYIAAMAWFGTAPSVMKPTALVLNILVATLGTVRWQRLGLIDWKALLPLLAISVPCAFIGGAIELPTTWYRILVGLFLLVAAVKLIWAPGAVHVDEDRPARLPLVGGGLAGGAVGLLSGLTGTGGGIFLSPILLFMGWAGPRQASGITVPFILLNSIAAIAGNLLILKSLPPELPVYAVAALAGALLGTQLGIAWATGRALQRLLGLVLIVAALKFLWV